MSDNNDKLVQACQKGDLDSVKALVKGHDVEKTGMSVEEMVSKEGETSPGDSRTPLQAAAEYQHMDIVQYLVNKFPTVDLIGQTNKYGYNSLHFAAYYSTNDEMLKFLIESYKKDIKDIINQKSNGGQTPLDYAYENHGIYSNSERSNIKLANSVIIPLLREYGAKSHTYAKTLLGTYRALIKKKPGTCTTPLLCACEAGDLDSVKVFVEGHVMNKESVKKEARCSNGISCTPLQAAVMYQRIDIVKYLVKTFPTVDLIGQTNSIGLNSLIYAAYNSKKDTQILQFLIDNYKGEINTLIDYKGEINTLIDMTLMDLILSKKFVSPIKNEIVSLLRENGAKTVCEMNNPDNPLVCACEAGDMDSVRVLVEGHDVEKTGMSVEEWLSNTGKGNDDISCTPLQMAVKNNHLDIVKYLVERFPDVDLIGQNNTNTSLLNSLHFAAWESDNVEILEFLIKSYKKDIKDIINEKDFDGQTPLDYAYAFNFSDARERIIKLLRKYGGKADRYDKNGVKVGEGNGDLNNLYDNVTIKF